jgi:hypothetical protein
MWENYPSKLQLLYAAVFSFYDKNCSFFVISPLFTVFDRIQQHWRHSKGGRKTGSERVNARGSRRGAVDMIYRIYRIYKIASSEELKIDCRKAARREHHRGRCKSICRILTTDRRAFALRMGQVKIPHSTCEHDRVRVFLPDPILTSQDLSRRSGNPRYEVACGARVGRRRRANPTFFHPSC